MNNKPVDSKQVFEEILTKTVEAHEKRISGIEQQVTNLPDYSTQLQQISRNITDLINKTNSSLSENNLTDLFENLKKATSAFGQPAKSNVVHHHHFPKLLYATCTLFLALCIAIIGWFLNVQTLNQYKANDTKYRYLKLQPNKNLRLVLQITDSLYLVSPTLRDSVIYKEEQNQRNIELLQIAEEKEAEAKRLRRKTKK